MCTTAWVASSLWNVRAATTHRSGPLVCATTCVQPVSVSIVVAVSMLVSVVGSVVRQTSTNVPKQVAASGGTIGASTVTDASCTICASSITPTSVTPRSASPVLGTTPWSNPHPPQIASRQRARADNISI